MFMWGYQPYFREMFESRAREVLDRSGVHLSPTVFLLGVLRPGETGLPVCIEPERGPLTESMFENLEDEIQSIIAAHPDQSLFYGDEPRMRDKRVTTRPSVMWSPRPRPLSLS